MPVSALAFSLIPVDYGLEIIGAVDAISDQHPIFFRFLRARPEHDNLISVCLQ